MSSDAVDSAEHPAPPAARREEALARLRALSVPEFVARSSLEAGAAFLVGSPGLLALYALDGALSPRARAGGIGVGAAAAAAPSTFPRLLAAAARYSLGCTARTVVWAAGTQATACLLREGARVGPRHEDAPSRGGARAALGAGALAGGVTGAALMADWAPAMGRARFASYVALAAMSGAALPDALIATGPAVRAALDALRPRT